MQNSEMLKVLMWLEKNGEKAVIFTANGFQLHGTVKRVSGDSFVMVCDSKPNVVNIHNVSTVVPPRKYLEE